MMHTIVMRIISNSAGHSCISVLCLPLGCSSWSIWYSIEVATTTVLKIFCCYVPGCSKVHNSFSGFAVLPSMPDRENNSQTLWLSWHLKIIPTPLLLVSASWLTYAGIWFNLGILVTKLILAINVFVMWNGTSIQILIAKKFLSNYLALYFPFHREN